jgi:hypothetical protein
LSAVDAAATKIRNIVNAVKAIVNLIEVAPMMSLL